MPAAADVGTGGRPNGRCNARTHEPSDFVDWPVGKPYAGKTLRDALSQQDDGSFLRTHPGVSGYNEVCRMIRHSCECICS